MIIYYCITIIANIVAIFIFHKSINISVLSIVPISLIAIMIFQINFFKAEKKENGFRTTYGSNFSDNEANQLFSSASTFLIGAIPWIIPFILFFSSPVKLLSVLIYVLGLAGGPILYKIKNRGKITNRISAEEQERREQEKKEQLGKWK
jgi:fatty acid desaturase